MSDILEYWKKYYSENELYCGGCYDRMTGLHFVLCSYEGKSLTKEEMEAKKKLLESYREQNRLRQQWMEDMASLKFW